MIDRVVPEPVGGAHRLRDAAYAALGDAIGESLKQHEGKSPADLKAQRREKFLAMGQYSL